jgi:hypothetical protein
MVGTVGNSYPAFEAAFQTTATQGQTIAEWNDGSGNALSIWINSVGSVQVEQIYGGDVAATAVSPLGMNDGEWHHIFVWCEPHSPRGMNHTLIVDGDLGSAWTATQIAWPLPKFTHLSIGGDNSGALFTGAVAHVAAYNSASVLSGVAADHASAVLNGFEGETTSARIGRVLDWIGFPSARRIFDTGLSRIGHLNPSGSSPMDYIGRILDTEDGIIYVDGAGNFVFHSRARGYSATSPDLVVPAQMLGGDSRMVQDLQLVVNEVTGTRSGGSPVTLSDAASITAYGVRSESLDLANITDGDLFAAVSWRLGARKDPRARFTNLTLDGMTSASYSPSIRAAIDMQNHVQITGMPAQAGSSTNDQIIQGWTLTIALATWSYAVNTSSYKAISNNPVLIYDDATYGKWDENIWAY